MDFKVTFVRRILMTVKITAVKTMDNVLMASDHSPASVPRASLAACARTRWTSAPPAPATRAPPVWMA